MKIVPRVYNKNKLNKINASKGILTESPFFHEGFYQIILRILEQIIFSRNQHKLNRIEY